MPNRSEILHFRATPEEKAIIEGRAEDVNERVSSFVRDLALFGVPAPDDSKLSPTQPAVEERARINEIGTARTAEGAVVREDHLDAVEVAWAEWRERTPSP